ncbi:hypothetical protein QMK19_39595 [Streptomyces sp. H10-C2]|uniref:hypothetical protein n=1 Tax=unclassified Streptomyces TaxID=2593676 RepID=UPI0024B896B7|nr:MULTISPECIES: hypothetical protein [unclassified Streptomyces]MDJ0347296.1 hypothetical protein [Streptomyces sp. PH10-H1]MDJ0375530.1 hypothetical protein [Streptomyces sp. H10-C2]
MRVRVGAVVVALLCAAGCAGTSVAPPAHSQPQCKPGPLVEADDGGQVCLAVGSTLHVDLAGSGWAPVTSSGPALADVSSDTFRGSAPGDVRLTSARRICPSPSAPGMVACHGMKAWSVTVNVVDAG